METYDYCISDDKNKLQYERIYNLLGTTYWAKNWSEERIKTSMENSLCFGVYLREKQIGFARCVTDYATVYWICDVVIDPEYRGNGIGNALIAYITEHEKLKPLMGILSTKHSKELYGRYGFRLSTNGFMIKSMPK